MKAELLKEECNKYQGDNECFIHCEKTQNGSYAILLGGNIDTIFYGLYFLLQRLADATQISATEWADELMRATRVSKTRTVSTNTAELRRHTQSETYEQEIKRLKKEISALERQIEDEQRVFSKARQEQIKRYSALDARYVRANKEIRELEKRIGQLEAENAALKSGGEF